MGPTPRPPRRRAAVSPDDERAMLDGFLAFYAEHPPDPAWEEAASEGAGQSAVRVLTW
jgi:hypothetical protein